MAPHSGFFLPVPSKKPPVERYQEFWPPLALPASSRTAGQRFCRRLRGGWYSRPNRLRSAVRDKPAVAHFAGRFLENLACGIIDARAINSPARIYSLALAA